MPASAREVAKLVGLPVAWTLCNDYHLVSRASQDGELVAPKSEMGRQFQGLARHLLAVTERPKPETSWKAGLKDLLPAPGRRRLRGRAHH